MITVERAAFIFYEAYRLAENARRRKVNLKKFVPFWKDQPPAVQGRYVAAAAAVLAAAQETPCPSTTGNSTATSAPALPSSMPST